MPTQDMSVTAGSLANATAVSFRELQETISRSIRQREPNANLREDSWQRPGGGGGETRVLENGEIWDRCGVNFSDITGDKLPQPATDRKPELAGTPFRAMGVSVVLHPKNPFAPSAHMNVRAFFLQPTERIPEGTPWWFGGGMDLTPCYGFEEDAVLWHQRSKECCDRYDTALYPLWKKNCDDYFYLPHRQECRGVGGIFFDDFNGIPFERTRSLAVDVGLTFNNTYFPIVDKRHNESYESRHLAFQKLRRGRYVEFNLLYDRGSRFGLVSGGRTESILMSLPSHVEWKYDWKAEPGSEEERLTKEFLQPRDWLECQTGEQN